MGEWSFDDRVAACFQALAIGDAIGKQTETLTRAEILKWYPEGITGFHGSPGDVIPRYSGKRYAWRIGETTDDSEQTLAVANALLRTGDAKHEAIGAELLECRKSLHPGVRLWEFHQQADPARIAPDGDGCGAAMRSAPIGVMHRASDLRAIAGAAYECAVPTHGGPLAIGTAAAVAAAVSAALEEQAAAKVLVAALQASQEAEALRPSPQPFAVAASIDRVYADLAARPELDAGEIAGEYFPNRPETIVPVAIALALITQSAERTALLAANIGGDSDSVASIGSAIAGAMHPCSVNREWLEIVRSINGDGLFEAAALLAARWPRP